LEPDDHVIYSNADICTHEYFYECVQELLAFGFDAITINRRTVGRSGGFPAQSKLPLAETGLVHQGFDCFVFRRGMYDRFAKNLACLGAGWVARGLLYNMVSHSEQMLMLKNVSLTYHYGNDLPWNRDDASDYLRHNFAQMHAVLVSLSQDPQAHERLTAFCQNHREPAAPPRYPRKAGSEAR
jgi:hypothetical protein